MKILSAKQVREVDAYTIKHEPIASIDLMERAATACFEWLVDHYSKDFPFKVFCGLGNNGGDGLVVARLLADKGYKVEVFIVNYSDKQSDDFKINLERIKKIKSAAIHQLTENKLELMDDISSGDILLDSIFGSGLSRPIDGFTADVVHKLNKSSAQVVAIDIPSGLFAEDNTENILENIVVADVTLSLEMPKLAFMFSENAKFVGQWFTIPIGLNQSFIDQQPGDFTLITVQLSKSIIRARSKFSHKGTFGNALLIAGSKGMMGAAVLAVRGSLRSGAGLVSACIPACGYDIMQSSVPEALAVVSDGADQISGTVDTAKYNAIGVGPGIGNHEDTVTMLKILIQNTGVPLVLDADAINIIAENKTWLSFVPREAVYTPHPGEFKRLIGDYTSGNERIRVQIKFSLKYGAYVVLKGMHTCITCPDGTCYFNSTGNPGMATGGTGDVLTGMITGLLAQGYSGKDACLLGVYLHGLAADIAVVNTAVESLTAGDLVDHIGGAFQYVKE